MSNTRWFFVFLFLIPLTLYAETQIRIVPGSERLPVRRELLGVNQLNYGRDSYGFLIPGTKRVNPEMTQILQKIGIQSMRYPGGCGGTHGYDWKRSAGLKGNYPSLGLMEFLGVCEEIEAEPMLGISAFRGSPEEAAEFVEFLNAPNDGKSVWAAERARLGHPEPFGVRYVEYGNECYHGNHSVKPNQQVTPAEYARNYLKFRTAMKKVDPNIELGVVLGPDYWNSDVFQGVGSDFDFGIVHHYQSVRQVAGLEYPQNFGVMKALRKQKEQILTHCPAEKRNTIRLALTEFNTTYAEHKHLTSALVNAETLFSLCQDPTFFAAHYWQFVNEGFGMVRGESGNFVKRPNALAFELFSRYLLDEVVSLNLSGRETSTGASVAAVGESETNDDRRVPDSEDFQKNLFQNPSWKNNDRSDRSVMEKSSNGTLTVRFLTDESYNYYHVAAWTATSPWKSVVYHLTAEIRTEGLKNTSGGALELGDGRGYGKTRSVTATESVLSGDWTPVVVDYFPLSDTRSLELKVRRFSGGAKGSIQIRNLNVIPAVYEPEAQPVISSLATVSRTGKEWAVLMVNRSMEPEVVSFTLDGSIANAVAETLTADTPFATNEETPDAVRIRPLIVTFSGSTVHVTVPPFSMAGMKGRCE